MTNGKNRATRLADVTKTPTRVAIYARLSRNPNGESESVERQVTSCRQYAASHDWPEVPDSLVFKDDDISAYSGKRRPGLEALWKTVDAGQVDAIVVWKLDRLTRRFSDAGPILTRLRDNKADLVSVQETLDTTTPIGSALIGILIAIAENESLNTSIRAKSYQADAATKGKIHAGGRRTFGYTQTRRDGNGGLLTDTVPEEADATREAVRRLIGKDGESHSLRSVAAWLNDQGLLTTAGKPWVGRSVRQYVRSPKIAGLRTHTTEGKDGKKVTILTDGEGWEPIISKEDREALLLRLGTQNPTVVTGPAGQRSGVRHLLTGLATCGKTNSKTRCLCGALMYVHHNRYWCQKCNGVSIICQPFEDYVTNQVLTFLSDAKLKPVYGVISVTAMEAELKVDEAELARVNRLRFIERTLTDKEWESLRDELTERIAASTAALKAAERDATEGPLQPGSRPDLDAWWENVEIEDRRAAMRSVLSSVLVTPTDKRGAGLDFSRIKLGYRFDRFVEADLHEPPWFS